MSTERPTPFEGKYEVLAKIAEGGMGAVYKVRHLLLDEIRVIKVMRPQVAESEDQKKRFLREAKTATRLKHPNIVTFYDFAMDQTDTAYMVMEFVDGVNLSELIRREGKIPLPIALQLSMQCLSALAYLHRRDIVHRDISPDNVLMARDEDEGIQAKLIDLGIVKVTRGEESLTAGDEFIGKLRYCSPEQLKAGGASTQIDGRSDLYSFGIVLYEMLTGICPFGGEGLHSIVSAHINGITLPFEDVDPQGNIPPSLRSAISRSLDPDPAKRFQTAEEFSKEISRLLSVDQFRTEPAFVRTYVDRALASRVRQVSGGDQPTIVTRESRGAPTLRHTWDEALEAGLGEPRRPAAPATQAPVQPEARPRRTRAWLIAAGVLVLAGLGYALLARRTSSTQEPGQVALAPTEVEAPTSSAASPAQDLVPTGGAADPEPTPRPAPEQVVPPVIPSPMRRPRSTPQPVEPARAVPEAVAAREPFRYCSTVEPTSYAQAAVKEAPAGFARDSGQVFRGPRPDAARIAIEVQIKPPKPVEGQPFEMTARLVNGGDMSITLTKIEESAVRSRAGFVEATGVVVPKTVEVGGALPIFRYSGVLTESNVFLKDLRVTDSVGDSWKTSIRLSVCAD
jgi:serine/threonine protein kinase